MFNWLFGRKRLSSEELVKQMLEESDDMLGVMPEVEQYVEAIQDY